MKKRGFTLIEMIFAIVVFSIVFVVLFSMFMRMIRLKNDIEARQTVVKSTYNLVEKINRTLQNYTIDYEEYFNRAMVGCNLANDAGTWNQGSNFVWNATGSYNQGGYCATPTGYGNQTAYIDGATYIDSNSQHRLYACSSDASINTTHVQPPTEERLVVGFVPNATNDACSSNLFETYKTSVDMLGGYGFMQAYGQYRAEFIDVKTDVDDKLGRAGDDDDTDLGKGPTAIQDADHVQELYLISKDKTKRILFRRALIATNDWNKNGSIDAPNERLYSLQMLQLKAFDAGANHDFDSLTYSGVYDGKTDTWACDAQAGFICKGTAITIGGIYDDYHLPLNVNDGWINITTNDITISDWNMHISPTKDPEFAWSEASQQRNPFITLYLKTTIYGQNRSDKLSTNKLDNINFDLQTSFNIKTNY